MEPVERLVALRLRAELEGLTEQELREDFGDGGPRVNHCWVTGMFDLVRIAGPLFIAAQLDDICLHSKNPSARFGACFVTAQYFPGRSEAYRVTRAATTDGFGGELLAKLFTSCQARDPGLLDDFSSGVAPFWYGSSLAPEHRRETLRVYASAMDLGVWHAACEVAAQTPENSRYCRVRQSSWNFSALRTTAYPASQTRTKHSENERLPDSGACEI